jgi:CRP/FNR family transcriptional regulator, cyclic AMP receptor protein
MLKLSGRIACNPVTIESRFREHPGRRKEVLATTECLSQRVRVACDVTSPAPSIGYPLGVRGDAEYQELKRIWLFSGCSQAELRKIQKVLETATVPTGTLLVEEGQPGLLFFIVIAGHASVQRGSRTVAALKAGDHFGELSLLDQEPRSASVVCETEMTLLIMRQRHFQKILSASPSMARKMLVTLSARLRDSDNRAY